MKYEANKNKKIGALMSWATYNTTDIRNIIVNVKKNNLNLKKQRRKKYLTKTQYSKHRLIRIRLMRNFA